MIVRNLAHIGLNEAHVVQPGFSHASPGPDDRARVTFYSQYLSRRTNQPGGEHGDVSDAGAKIQDTLAWANACLTKESFGVRSDPRGLPN